MKEIHKAWLAGIIDGEGTISVASEKPRKYMSVSRYIYPYISVTNTDPKIPYYCKEITKLGTIFFWKVDNPNHNDWYRWTVRGNNAIEILKEILPYLISKRDHAKLAFKWLNLEKFVGYHKKGTIAISKSAMKMRHNLHNQFKILNKRGCKMAERRIANTMGLLI